MDSCTWDSAKCDLQVRPGAAPSHHNHMKRCYSQPFALLPNRRMYLRIHSTRSMFAKRTKHESRDHHQGPKPVNYGSCNCEAFEFKWIGAVHQPDRPVDRNN